MRTEIRALVIICNIKHFGTNPWFEVFFVYGPLNYTVRFELLIFKK